MPPHIKRTCTAVAENVAREDFACSVPAAAIKERKGESGSQPPILVAFKVEENLS